MAEKDKLALGLAKLEKDYGKGTIMRIGDNPQVMDFDVVSTGSLQIDLDTGIGGVRRGRIYEIMGWESSGKTTITLHMIAEHQKLGLKAALVDAEHAFDAKYAAAIGVNLDDLYISQPQSGEEGLNVVDVLLGTDAFGIIVIDSVAALTPQKEIDGVIGASSIGLQSRMMGQAMRKMASLADKSNTTLVFINQIREKIGVMFGSPETTAGGNALRFYASMRFDVRKRVDLENLLNTTTVKIIKNKLAPPFKKSEIDIVWGVGIDQAKEVLDLSVEMGIIKKAGAFYSYGTDKLGQGQAKVRALFKDNPEFYEKIRGEVLQKIKDGYKREEEEAAEVSSEGGGKEEDSPVS